MKAISIQQPWAWAIFHAGKDIENRSWSTSFRGELAVHATRIQSGWQFPPGVAVPPEQDLVLGSVIGLVEIVDVVTHGCSRWFSGPRGFVLRNPQLLTSPIPCPGNQGIWELPAWIHKAVRERAAAPDQSASQGTLGEPKEQGPGARLLSMSDPVSGNSASSGLNAMDIAHALEIVGALAGGRHPVTGLPLGEDHICQHPQVVRALCAVVGRLRSVESRDRPIAASADKAGRPWTAAEEAELLREFAAGGRIRQLARKHGRTDLSIRGRLYRLGKLPAWSASRQRAEEADGVW
jgi:hypothetical protein